MAQRSVGAAAAVVAVLLAAFFAPHARAAADPEFGFGLGYSHVSLDDTSVGAFDGEGGGRFEFRFSIAPIEDVPRFRLGFGLGLSGFYDETDGSAIFIDDDGDVILADSDDFEQLSLFTPELQLSWRQRWENGFVLETGVGLGGVIGYYAAGDEFFEEFYDTELDETAAAWSVRPFIRAGARMEGGWTFGVEGSYLWGGELDFTDEIGGDVEEWYVGVFFAFSR